MIFFFTEHKIDRFILHQIVPESRFLLCYPGEGQACCEEYVRRADAVNVQFPCNGSKGQNVIIFILHFVGGEFFVSRSDEIIPVVPDKHIAFENRLLVVSQYTGPEHAVGSFHISVAVIHTDDFHIVFCVNHNFPLSPRLSGASC